MIVQTVILWCRAKWNSTWFTIRTKFRLFQNQKGILFGSKSTRNSVWFTIKRKSINGTIAFLQFEKKRKSCSVSSLQFPRQISASFYDEFLRRSAIRETAASRHHEGINSGLPWNPSDICNSRVPRGLRRHLIWGPNNVSLLGNEKFAAWLQLMHSLLVGSAVSRGDQGGISWLCVRQAKHRPCPN